MKKRVVSFLLLACMVLGMLAGCQKDPVETQGNNPGGDTTEAAKQTDEDRTEATPEEEPDIEIFLMSNWGGILPPEEEDIYKQKMDELWGGNWHLTLPTDGKTEIVTRFASGKAPDVVQFNDTSVLNQLYEQGVLVDDWYAYADLIPNFLENMTEEQRALFTSEDGKLKAVGYVPGEQNWAWLIRQDWLDNLGLKMPTTVEDLLEVMKAFTFDDPDGNGQDDTYGISVAGGGNVGELKNLIELFSQPSYYATKDGASHPIVDGTYQDYLDFARAIVEAEVINPDWYTLGWDDRKPDLYAGKYGIVWYPGNALLNETSKAVEDKTDTTLAECWAVMDVCGGKGHSKPIKGASYLSVSAEAAADPEKMEIICKYLEGTTGYTDEYFLFRGNVGLVDDCGYKEISDGMYYTWENRREDEALDILGKAYSGIWNWGKVCNASDGHTIGGTSAEYDKWVECALALESEIISMDKWESDDRFYAPDATINATVDAVRAEFEISYIMGETDDYEGFVENWLASGGQQLLDDATACFEKFGLID